MNNSIIFIGIIIILIGLCIYIYITKNNEIDDLSSEVSDNSKTVSYDMYNNAINEIQTLNISFNELQEQCNSAGINYLANYAAYVRSQDIFRQQFS